MMLHWVRHTMQSAWNWVQSPLPSHRLILVMMLMLTLAASAPAAPGEVENVHADQPASVLNSEAFPDAPWAAALREKDPQRAIAEYVKQLRAGPARADRRHGTVEVFRRWMGQRIGFSEGHH